MYGNFKNLQFYLPVFNLIKSQLNFSATGHKIKPHMALTLPDFALTEYFLQGYIGFITTDKLRDISANPEAGN